MADNQKTEHHNMGGNPHDVMSITKVEYDQLKTHEHNLKEANEEIRNKKILIEEFHKLLLSGGIAQGEPHPHQHHHAHPPTLPFLEQVSSVFGNAFQVNTGYTQEVPSRIEVKMEGNYKTRYDDIIKKLKESNK